MYFFFEWHGIILFHILDTLDWLGLNQRSCLPVWRVDTFYRTVRSKMARERRCCRLVQNRLFDPTPIIDVCLAVAFAYLASHIDLPCQNSNEFWKGKTLKRPTLILTSDEIEVLHSTWPLDKELLTFFVSILEIFLSFLKYYHFI